MSYATESQMTEAITPQTPPPTPTSVGQEMTYRIKRSGARPLKFAGSELAMAMSFTPACPYWYEINLYRTTDIEFVVAVRIFHQAEDVQDNVEAWKFATLEDALWQIESYDAAGDIVAPFPDDMDSATPADLAADAMELRARIKAARQHYHGLAGEILCELDGGQ